MTNIQMLEDIAMELRANNTAVIAVSKIPFRREFRAACRQNTCGKFGRCWMCPPDVGDIDEMIAHAKTRRLAFVFQTVTELEDSFDFEGMQAAAIRHNKLLRSLTRKAKKLIQNPIKMGAGACHVCNKCTKIDEKPCRHPDKATTSMESYGVSVSELAELCGLKYINGPNTVTYFGAILFTLL